MAPLVLVLVLVLQSGVVVEGIVVSPLRACATPLSLPAPALHRRHMGCDVYIVGCLHGAPTSAEDVVSVIEQSKPQAVVLELCQSRYEYLAQELARQQSGEKEEHDPRGTFGRWWKGVTKVERARGMGAASLAGVLSLPYAMQKAMNLDPGMEFKGAMACASDQPHTIDIVLGDRDVKETLRRLGVDTTQPPSGALGEADPAWEEGSQAEQALAGLRVLRRALWGSTSHKGEYVNVLGCIFGRASFVTDLVSILGPLTLGVLGACQLLDVVTGSAAATAATSSDLDFDSSVTMAVNVVNAVILPLFFFNILKFFRIVIQERDVYLASAIEKAAGLYPGSSIVCVCGLLHANGIAEILSSENDIMEAA